MARAARNGGSPLLGVALIALVFVCYVPSIQGEFLWDDDSNVSENPTLLTFDGLVKIWTSPFANQQYYPLTHSSFWLEYQLWGLRPTGFRITNLLLHGLVAWLLWTTLRRLEVPGAWVAAAVFALHPVHVESVAWITERKNLLSAVLYFAAMLAYLRFARLDGSGGKSDRRAYVWALVLFALMLLSKTAFLTLPVALLILVWWKRGTLTRGDLMPTLPMFAMALGFGLLTAWLERGHVGAGGVEWELGLVERVLVAGRALWFYAGKTLLPLGLNFIYPRWEISAGAVAQYVYPLAALALPVLLWRHRERVGRGPLVGVLFFGVTVAPALGFLDFYFQLYAFVQDHFQYLASAGLIAVVVGLATVALRHAPAWVPQVVALLLLIGLGGLTWARSSTFVDQETLWMRTLERNPQAWMAEINLGLHYHDRNRFTDAVERFRRAIEIPGGQHDKAHYNLGRSLEELGRPEEARGHYRQALEINPLHEDARNNLANLMTYEGDRAGAIEQYRAALEANPDYYLTHYNLALALAAEGLDFEAERHFKQATRLNPAHADSHDGLGRILAAQRRDDEAMEAYKRALTLDSNRPDVFYNMGLIHERRDDIDAAESHYRAAIRLNPDLAEAHNNLAIVLYHKGRYAEAWQEVRRFQELGGAPHPGFIQALTEASP